MNINTIENGSTVVFFGDSTTDCGRARPISTYATGLGDSYVSRIHEIYTAAYPEKEVKFVNAGNSGETSRHTRARWISEFETLKPDYATLLIGVNDVWRKYDRWMNKEMAVSIEEYEDNIRFMTDYAVKHTKGFTLIAPYYFEMNKKDPFLKDILAYSDVCKKVAEEYGCEFISLQNEFTKLMKVRYSYFLSGDNVHPKPVTHMVIAMNLLKKWKFKF